MIKRYYHTIRYLKPIQIVGRLWFNLKKPKIYAETLPKYQLSYHWVENISKSQTLIAPFTFFMHHCQHTIHHKNDWDAAHLDRLFIYNCHYFDDLNAQKSKERNDWHRSLITHWMVSNPPYQGIGWDPYPVSLRIVNWIKWILNGAQFSDDLLISLAYHVSCLSQCLEYHLQANHLLANAKALLFAGIFLNKNNHFKKAMNLLQNELEQQILTDGGHVERSTMYHGIVLEDLLDCINLLSAYDIQVPSEWNTLAQNMLIWLKTMCHPDDEIALFNDAALDVAPHYSELKSYAQRLGISIAHESIPEFLPNSGYAHLTSNRVHLYADVAPIGPDHQPGHAHADTFTFELSIGDQRIIVNSGTSTYERNEERHRQRGTLAHNTLTINDSNSSDVWAAFRVGKRARVHNVKYENQGSSKVLSAYHDGYWNFTGKIRHFRTWNLSKDELVINDRVDGTGIHDVKLSFHLHPDLEVIPENNTYIILKNRQLLAEILFDEKLTVSIVNTSYHPEFGSLLLNKKMVAHSKTLIPIVFITKIRWYE